MKRMIVNKYGGPENLVLEKCGPPTIKELSVRIRIENNILTIYSLIN